MDNFFNFCRASQKLSKKFHKNINLNRETQQWLKIYKIIFLRFIEVKHKISATYCKSFESFYEYLCNHLCGETFGNGEFKYIFHIPVIAVSERCSAVRQPRLKNVVEREL